MVRGWSALLLIVIAETAAAAAPARLRVVAAGRRAFVVRGPQRVELPIDGGGRSGPVIEVEAKMKPDGSAVVAVEYNCTTSAELAFTSGQLEARLENAAALRRHKARRYAEAAAGFARAVALDPAWNLPRTNLAAALALGGDRPSAVAALVALAAIDPPWVAWRLASDPELAGLADAPELAGVTGEKGTATAAALEAVPVAYAARRSLVAYLATDEGGLWEGWSHAVRIVDMRTGKEVASMPVGGHDGDCARRSCLAAEKKRNAERAAQVTRALAGLGFAAVDKAAWVELGGDYGGVRKGVFAGTRLGVVAKDDAVRVVTGDRVLAEGHGGGFWQWAALLPGGNVVVKTNHITSEDCGNVPYDDVVLLALEPVPGPAPPAPAR